MDSHLFRRGHWIIDLRDDDANNHLYQVGFTQDTLLIIKYFVHLLYVDAAQLGVNEFSEHHDELKDAIVDVLLQKFGPASRQISAVIEGIVKKSLIKDGCIVDGRPHPKWTGSFHEYADPKNFYQILEGALRDPRSRIGPRLSTLLPKRYSMSAK